MFWTEDKIRLLKQIIEIDGREYSYAAKVLQCSRNAAVGKGGRLGLVSQNAARGGKHNPNSKANNPVRPATNGHVTRTALVPVSAAPVAPSKPVAKPAKTKRRRIRLSPELHEDDKLFFEIVANLKPRPSSTITNIPGKFQCKWITGDVKSDKDATWCRKPVKEGTCWCPAHYVRVYDVGRAFIKRKRK